MEGQARALPPWSRGLASPAQTPYPPGAGVWPAQPRLHTPLEQGSGQPSPDLTPLEQGSGQPSPDPTPLEQGLASPAQAPPPWSRGLYRCFKGSSDALVDPCVA
jgi:hypothetical protein